MRIAEVAPPWIAVPPKGYGGIEWVVSLVADGLAERGHDVTLFATGDSRTAARLEFVFERAAGSRWINSVWHDTLHTLHAFRDPGAFDLYHVHVPWAALVAGNLIDRPVVHTVHGAFNERMRDLFGRVGDRAWFVAISESQRQQMPELRYAGVVHNGIDVERYPLQPDKEDYLLFLGRAAPEKGLLRAVLTARETGLPLVLALKVADQYEREHWEHEVKPLLPSDTVVHGELGHRRKVRLLAGARAVLFPIDWEEPFGLVMTEAMACGTPVIATPRGAAPEVVADGETGFIVPVQDYPAAAAECLARLDQIDPKACRARVEHLFSKEAMVEGYERAFERVLSGAG